MELRKQSHSVYQLEYHVIWTSKYRRRVLKPGMQAYLQRVFPKLLRSMPGVEIETIGFEADHVHMLMVIPPKYSISEVMARLKSQSASSLRDAYPWLKKVYWNENVVWSPGYFVSSVGINESIVMRYIEHQGNQDSGQLRLKL